MIGGWGWGGGVAGPSVEGEIVWQFPSPLAFAFTSKNLLHLI